MTTANTPQPPARILVVDDEINLAEGIKENLLEEGYHVDVATDGIEGLQKIQDNEYDLVLLDVMMPGRDGFAVCQQARKDGNDVPILFLTAKSSVQDRIRGLEDGGDDYLSKPFHLHELLLRVQAILRRRIWYDKHNEVVREVSFGGNVVDFRTYRARSWDHREHELTQKEAMILKALVEREREVVSREDILRKAWGYEIYPSTRTIDNFIVRLRKRFERDPETPRHFHTVRGVGYRDTGDAT